MRCPVGAVKPSPLGAVNRGCAFYFFPPPLLFNKKCSEIAVHGNRGCQTSGFTSACRNEHLLRGGTLKSPRRRRRLAAFAEQANESLRGVCRELFVLSPAAVCKCIFRGSGGARLALRQEKLPCSSAGSALVLLPRGSFRRGGRVLTWEHPYFAALGGDGKL